MTPVGARVRKIREDHGDSLLDAEKRTGVSKSTIQRIEQGYACRDLVKYLSKIAEGYGVPEAVLLEASTLKGMFEGFIRSMTLPERFHYLRASSSDRAKFMFDFVRVHCPQKTEDRGVALAAGVSQEEVTQALAVWPTRSLDRRTTIALMQGLTTVTAMNDTWFHRGWLDGEPGLVAQAAAYANRLGLRIKKSKIPITLLDLNILQQVVEALG